MLSVGERFTANAMPLQLSPDDFFIDPESIHAFLPLQLGEPSEIFGEFVSSFAGSRDPRSRSRLYRRARQRFQAVDER